MELRITLGRDEIEQLVEQAAPLRIHLGKPDGKQRWIELEEPRDVRLVEDDGLSLTMAGRFHFDLAKVPLGDEIRDIHVMIRPRVNTDETGMSLLDFHLDIDEADLVTVPDVIDRPLVEMVDRATTPKSTRLRVPFQQMLSAVGELSPRLQPLARARTTVAHPSVTVKPDRVIFAVDLEASLESDGKPGEQPTA